MSRNIFFGDVDGVAQTEPSGPGRWSLRVVCRPSGAEPEPRAFGKSGRSVLAFGQPRGDGERPVCQQRHSGGVRLDPVRNPDLYTRHAFTSCATEDIPFECMRGVRFNRQPDLRYIFSSFSVTCFGPRPAFTQVRVR